MRVQSIVFTFLLWSIPHEGNKKKNNRSRNITWFNPPYSANVKPTRGGGGEEEFLKLLDKHFPKGHKLNKVFNRNTVKVSFSCMKNMDAITRTHNQKKKKSSISRINHPQPIPSPNATAGRDCNVRCGEIA